MVVKGRENRSVCLSLSPEDVAFFSRQSLKHRFSLQPVPGSNDFEVYADNVIGAIRLPSGLEYFIEPKMTLPNVLKMLSYIEGQLSPISDNVHFAKDMGVFDVLAQLFAVELQALARVGLKSEYIFKVENRGKIQGRILIERSVKACQIYNARVFCRFNDLSVDTPRNRAVLAAARSLLRSPFVKDRTRKSLVAALNRLPTAAIGNEFQISDFAKLTFDRSTNHYKRIIFVAKLILQGMSFSQSSGASPLPGFLLNMASLFEKYVERALKTHTDPAVVIQAQKRDDLDASGEIAIKPDLVFSQNGRVVRIADTKYKNFTENGFTETDVYQMMAYLIRHDCAEGFLIYPTETGPSEIKKRMEIRNGGSVMRIAAVCIRVDEPAEVSRCLGELMGLGGELIAQPA